jgi:sensor histidine kinase YesM
MKWRNLYLNFWVRNSVVFVLTLLILLIVSYYTATPEELESIPDGIKSVFFIHIFFYLQVIIHNAILYEKFLKRRLFKQYILLLLLLWAVFVVLNMNTPYGISSPEENNVGGHIMNTLFIFILGFGMYAIHENIILKNISFQHKLISKEEEIRYLKAQLNPHFLFNALNNLYGSALSTPHETGDKILALSDLLRYQIESSQKEIVSLKDEIEYLKMYTDYELNRNSKLKLDFEVMGNPLGVDVPPLILMPFLENAIKFSNETAMPTISMKLFIENKKLSFILTNNYHTESNRLVGTNTGILNTKKRLAIYFEKKYQLNIKKEDDLHTVDLTLFR